MYVCVYVGLLTCMALKLGYVGVVESTKSDKRHAVRFILKLYYPWDFRVARTIHNREKWKIVEYYNRHI